MDRFKIVRRAFILRALKLLDEWCDKAGVPMSLRENFKDPWRAMLDELEDGKRKR